MMLDKLELKQFKSFVNTHFEVYFEPDKALSAQLVKIEALKGDTDLERSPFSLIFETDQQDAFYTQGIYKITHPQIEELHLFFVPIGKSENGMKYEVVFS